MQAETTELLAPDFLALTVGIVVFFVGVLITQRIEFLRRYSIPEPVTGGFVAALVFWAVHRSSTSTSASTWPRGTSSSSSSSRRSG